MVHAPPPTRRRVRDTRRLAGAQPAEHEVPVGARCARGRPTDAGSGETSTGEPQVPPLRVATNTPSGPAHATSTSPDGATWTRAPATPASASSGSTSVTTHGPVCVRGVVHALVPGVRPDEREVDGVVGADREVGREQAETPARAPAPTSTCRRRARSRATARAGCRVRRRRSRTHATCDRPSASTAQAGAASAPQPSPSSPQRLIHPRRRPVRSRRRSPRGSRCPRTPAGCVQSRSIARCAVPSASIPRSGGPSW